MVSMSAPSRSARASSLASVASARKGPTSATTSGCQAMTSLAPSRRTPCSRSHGTSCTRYDPTTCRWVWLRRTFSSRRAVPPSRTLAADDDDQAPLVPAHVDQQQECRNARQRRGQHAQPDGPRTTGAGGHHRQVDLAQHGPDAPGHPAATSRRRRRSRSPRPRAERATDRTAVVRAATRGRRWWRAPGDPRCSRNGPEGRSTSSSVSSRAQPRSCREPIRTAGSGSGPDRSNGSTSSGLLFTAPGSSERCLRRQVPLVIASLAGPAVLREGVRAPSDHRVRPLVLAVVRLVGHPRQRQPGHRAGGEHVRAGAVVGEHHRVAHLVGDDPDPQGRALPGPEPLPGPPHLEPAPHDEHGKQQDASGPRSPSRWRPAARRPAAPTSGRRSPAGPGWCSHGGRPRCPGPRP